MIVTLPVADVTAGKPTAVRVDEHISVAVCLVEGNFYAFDNKCPHHGGPLAEGVVEGNLVVCPLHHFKFDVATGRCTRPRHLKMRTYAVAREGELLQIRIEPSEMPAVPDQSSAAGCSQV